MLLLVSGPDMVPRLARDITSLARELMARFWPGPLTLILPARPELSPRLTGGTGGVGLRQPRHEVTCRLIAALGLPVTGTSDWRKVAITVPAPPNANGAQIYLGLGDSRGTAWFDDVSLAQGTAVARDFQPIDLAAVARSAASPESVTSSKPVRRPPAGGRTSRV